ncbi:MAG: hypothetical protein JW791_04460 [Nanoarchaeota archaeon]|nr:hypothetical protein [Nanoarchaeota archaeon]
MKKYFLISLALLLFLPAFSDNEGQGNMSDYEDLLVSPMPVLYQNGSMNQEQVMEQIQTALQLMNQTQLRINATTVQVQNGQVSVLANQEGNTNMIRVSLNSVEVEGVVVDEDVESPVLIRSRIQTSTGSASVNVIREQNRILIQQEGAGVNVSLSLNNELLFQEGRMYLNVSGNNVEVTVTPQNALIAAQVKNQSRIQVELYSEEGMPKYRIMEEKTVRLLGIMPLNMNTETVINSVNGNLEQVVRPWWSFLTIE